MAKSHESGAQQPSLSDLLDISNDEPYQRTPTSRQYPRQRGGRGRGNYFRNDDMNQWNDRSGMTKEKPAPSGWRGSDSRGDMGGGFVKKPYTNTTTNTHTHTQSGNTDMSLRIPKESAKKQASNEKQKKNVSSLNNPPVPLNEKRSPSPNSMPLPDLKKNTNYERPEYSDREKEINQSADKQTHAHTQEAKCEAAVTTSTSAPHADTHTQSTQNAGTETKGKWRRKAPMTMQDRLNRDIKSLLNKLTIEKFPTICERLCEIGDKINTESALHVLAESVLEKAVTEPDFSEMYADVCLVLIWRTPQTMNFKKTLLSVLQDEFERMPVSLELSESDKKTLSAEDQEIKTTKLKTRVLGVCKLMGELFLRDVVTIKVLSIVTSILIFKNDEPEEHFIECMCELLMSTGYHLDCDAAHKNKVNLWVQRLTELRSKGTYTARIAFRIQDILDVRKVNWAKKIHKGKAKTLSEIKNDIERDDLLGGSTLSHTHGTVVTAGKKSEQSGKYGEYITKQQETYNKRKQLSK